MPSPFRTLSFILCIPVTCATLRADDAPATHPEILVFPSGSITVGHDTTRISGPRRADGSIDYVRALDEKLAAGVTAKNNAAVVLATVVGPDFATPRAWKAMWEVWKVSPPGEAEHWMDFEHFVKAHPLPEGAETFDPTDVPSKGLPAERATLQAWLKSNEKVLDKMVEGSKLPRYWVPTFVPPPADTLRDDRLPGLYDARYICDALCCRALLRLEAKDYAGFESDLKAVWRWGKLIGNAPTLIFRLIGLATEQAATHACLTAMRTSDLPEPVLADLADFLAGLPPTPPLADALDLEERMGVLDFVQSCARLGPQRASSIATATPEPQATKNVLMIDYDRVMKLVNADYDRMVAAAAKPKFAERAAAVAKINDDIAAKQESFKTVPAQLADFGGFIAATMMPHLGRIVIVETTKQERHEELTLAISLARYRLKHGAYPDKLDGLRGEFVKVIPPDRFIDAPLHYQVREGGFILYSVGANMVDDGGESTGKMDDIAVVKK